MEGLRYACHGQVSVYFWPNIVYVATQGFDVLNTDTDFKWSFGFIVLDERCSITVIWVGSWSSFFRPLGSPLVSPGGFGANAVIGCQPCVIVPPCLVSMCSCAVHNCGLLKCRCPFSTRAAEVQEPCSAWRPSSHC